MDSVVEEVVNLMRLPQIMLPSCVRLSSTDLMLAAANCRSSAH